MEPPEAKFIPSVKSTALPPPQPLSPRDTELSNPAQRAIEQLAEDVNREDEGQILKGFIHELSAPLPEKVSLSEDEVRSKFAPLWQFLDRSHPHRKAELISSLAHPVIRPNAMRSSLIDAVCEKMLDVDPKSLVTELKKWLTYPLTPASFYTFLFKVWERNKGNPDLNELLTRFSLSGYHNEFPEFVNPLISAVVNGELELDFTIEGCWDGDYPSTAGRIEFWIQHLPLIPEQGHELLQKPIQPLTPTRAALYFKCLDITLLHRQPAYLPLRNQLVMFLLQHCGRYIIPWVKNNVPGNDPLHGRIIECCPTSDLIKLLEAYPTAKNLQRLEALGAKLTQLEAWSDALGDTILPVAKRVHGQFLRSLIENPYPDWIAACPTDIHLWTFDRLAHFIDFPNYWPFFNFSEGLCEWDKRQQFLLGLALFWPDLRFSQEQQNPYPNLDLMEWIEDPGLLGQLLRNRHFPDRAPFPTLPADLPLNLSGYLARYYSLSDPNYRKRFKEELPVSIARILPLIRRPFIWSSTGQHKETLERPNHVFLALLLFRIMAKIAEYDKNLPEIITGQFKQLLNSTCSSINNDLREAFVLVSLIDQLKAAVPNFLIKGEIDLRAVEVLRVQINKVIPHNQRIP